MQPAYNPRPMRNLLLCALALFAATLAAQDAYEINTRLGVGGSENSPGLVAGPFTPLVVDIHRNDTRPFAGRVVVETMGGSRRGRRGGPFASEPKTVEFSQEITIEQGVGRHVLRMDLPVFGHMLDGQVSLEARVGDSFEPLAVTTFSAGVRGDGRMLAGFVSQARLGAAQPYVFAEIIEIQTQDLPDSWKLLACFDVVILNDDRLTRKQAEALVDYVVAGGQLIISPGSGATFNPELPAARLLGLSGGSQRTAKLSQFDGLRAMPKRSGMSRTNPGDSRSATPVPEGEAEAEPGEPLADLPAMPDDNADILLWPASARARAVDDMRGLMSYVRAGAGVAALLHVDLSQYPLVTTGSRAPTTAGVNLLAGALRFAQRGHTRPALSRLAGSDVRDQLEIAGRRIPGRDFQVLLIFLYVGAAGVGLFVLARRLKRPEVYPAALVVLALLSVLLVFSLGQVYKRAGDRAQAARLVVSDGVSGRSTVFTAGCSYIADQTSQDFSQDRAAWLVPSELGSQDLRGLPDDYLAHSARLSAMETVTAVTGLVRWQNLFFSGAEPAALADLQMRVVGDGSGHTVENRSGHTLRGCIVLVGGLAASASGSGATSPQTCQWHYLPLIGAAGSADARVPLSKATSAPAEGNDIADRMRADCGDHELAAQVATAILGLSENRRLRMPRSQGELERVLEQCSLLPLEGEYLVLALLPDDAVSKGSLGLRGIEPDRVGQAVIWAARGLVESR